MQIAWAAVVAAAWIGALAILPLDPDYTAGELLDHLMSWRSTGVLYGDPAVAPYHVLNYPPTFLALARLLVALGISPLLAGRLLGSAGVICALAVVWRWLREDGLEATMAWAVVALVATSFPLLYSSGQFHLEGFASAATLAGFWLARRPGRGVSLIAGGALAAGCLIKQPQVVLSIVALAWVWRYRGRERWLVLAGYVVTGTVGCALITVCFGREAWRQMITDTVGTFSVSQLGFQFASHLLPWVVFGSFAIHAALRDRAGWRDIRSWYLVGATVWMVSAARVGAGYPYFIDWQLAVLLWIGTVVHDWVNRSNAPLTGMARISLVAFAIQVIVADGVVAGVLGYDLRTTWRTAEVLPSICAYVPAAPALTPSESPGLVRACGGRAALDPFIMANLTDRGLWDQTPFVRDLANGRYSVIVLPFDPQTGARGTQRERWTNRVVAAMAGSYRLRVRVGDWWVLRPAVAPHD